MAPLEASSCNNTDAESWAQLEERAIREPQISKYWHLGQLSFPAGLKWDEAQKLGSSTEIHKPSSDQYAYHFDDSAGTGQTFYMIETGWIPNPDVSQSWTSQDRAGLYGPQLAAVC